MLQFDFPRNICDSVFGEWSSKPNRKNNTTYDWISGSDDETCLRNETVGLSINKTIILSFPSWVFLDALKLWKVIHLLRGYA